MVGRVFWRLPCDSKLDVSFNVEQPGTKYSGWKCDHRDGRRQERDERQIDIKEAVLADAECPTRFPSQKIRGEREREN